MFEGIEMRPKEIKNTILEEGLDKKLTPTEALERINSLRIETANKIRAAQNPIEEEEIGKEAIDAIEAILISTEPCEILPKGWREQSWENLSMTISRLHLANETAIFYLV